MFTNNPRIVAGGLTLCLDGAASTSYPARNFVGCKTYSVYNGGLRSANYTVQYSDDNSSWTTAFSGVCSNDPYASCGIKNNTGLGDGSYGARRYWRYVEGSAIVSHHPRVSRIILTDINGKDYNLHVYVADNCSDSGTYLVGTVSVDVAGTTWYDVSGNAYNGTIIGASYQTTGGGSFDLDGTDDYIALPSALRSLFSSGPNCFDIWLYKSAAAAGAQVVFDMDITRWNINYNLYVSNKWTFDYYDGTERVITAGNYDDSWVNFTAQQLSDNTIEFYANGILIGSEAASALAPNGNTIRLGSRTDGAYYFNGNISEVKIYDRSLTQAEVKQNFNTFRSRFGL